MKGIFLVPTREISPEAKTRLKRFLDRRNERMKKLAEEWPEERIRKLFNDEKKVHKGGIPDEKGSP